MKRSICLGFRHVSVSEGNQEVRNRYTVAITPRELRLQQPKWWGMSHPPVEFKPQVE